MNKSMSLLSLRFKQLKRMIESVGLILLALFLIVVAGFFFQLLGSALHARSEYSILAVLGILLSVDIYRKDKVFLKSIFNDHKTMAIYLSIEYFLLSLGFIIFQFWEGNFGLAFKILCCALIIAFISPLFQFKFSEARKTSISCIPNEYFELKYAIEMNAIAWALFYCFGLLGTLHIAFYLIWCFLIILTLPNIFSWNESREMVHWKPYFVRTKIIATVKNLSIVLVLPLLLVLIFHSDMWHVILYSIVCLITAIVLSVSYKYALFSTIYPSSQTSNVLVIMILLLILPGGVIVTLIYSIIQYLKAEANMKMIYA